MKSETMAATQSQSHQSGGHLSLISCVSGREGSPMDEDETHQTSEIKTDTKKKKFHPLRNLRRMFRRKARNQNVSNESCNVEPPGNTLITTVLEQRSSSTSRLLEEGPTQTRMRNSGLSSGLSLSHDSVFTPDRADSGHSSSDLENSSLSIPILIPASRFQAELADVVMRRNRGESDEEDEDLGLPRSPSSPLTTAEKTQEHAMKSHHSSCSEASLLSTGSSDVEMEPVQVASDLDLGVPTQKLSHNAARHKMAIRPKRNHGAPHSKRRIPKSGSSLPVTPEVNEEAVTPRSPPAEASTAAMTPTDTGMSEASSPMSPSCVTRAVPDDFQLRTSSLPHGAALSSNSPKIVRSRSNVAGYWTGEKTTAAESFGKRSLSVDDQAEDDSGDSKKDSTDEKDEDERSKKEESFFGRLLSRRSGKKKKMDLESKKDATAEVSKEVSRSEEEKSVVHFAKKLPCTKAHQNAKITSGTRSADRRQRVEPIDIPTSPSLLKKEDSTVANRNVPESANRMKISYSMSPPRPTWPSQAISRSISPPKAVWPEHYSYYAKPNTQEQLQNTRKNMYQSNWDESFKQMNKETLPGGHFIKNESASSKYLKRDTSPVKQRRESSPSRFHTKEISAASEDAVDAKAKVLISSYENTLLQKSQSFKKEANIPVSDYANIFNSLEDQSKKTDEGENKPPFGNKANPRVSTDEDSSKRLYTKNVNTCKSKTPKKDEKSGIALKLTKKSTSLESIGSFDVTIDTDMVSLKSSSTDRFRSSFPGAGVLITHEEPQYVNVKSILPSLNNYDKVHHGYENIQIIELVKKEAESKTTQRRSFFEDLSNKTSEKPPKGRMEEPDVSKKDASRTPEPEIERKGSKPPLFEKPKELKKDVPEFMRVHLRSSVASSPDKTEVKVEDSVESVVSAEKAKATLIERRKSELMMTKESEDSELSTKIKILKKQTSFTETGSPKRISMDDVRKRSSFNEETEAKVKTVLIQKPEDNIVIIEKTEGTEETEKDVFLRKKSVAKESEEQPELMKVFARRSLKVKEDDEVPEDGNRSRDSDKENESVESPKEERRKTVKAESEPKKTERKVESSVILEVNRPPIKMKATDEVKINITPLKPAVARRNCVFHKYERSLSENNAKKNEEVKNNADIVNKLNGRNSVDSDAHLRKDNSVIEANVINKIIATNDGFLATKKIRVEVVEKEPEVPSEPSEEREDSEEAGFKRIQQRKAEWERRAQQAAKRSS